MSDTSANIFAAMGFVVLAVLAYNSSKASDYTQERIDPVTICHRGDEITIDATVKRHVETGKVVDGSAWGEMTLTGKPCK